ncbi:hypothetical protein RUM43_006019 [Polyplax serrata]|uniref:Uncharacterized protein n=1 Tax=Polyplax serrata TaxID=468196 RepID=A0AAN8S396_POLSC
MDFIELKRWILLFEFTVNRRYKLKKQNERNMNNKKGNDNKMFRMNEWMSQHFLMGIFCYVHNIHKYNSCKILITLGGDFLLRDYIRTPI